MFKNVNSCIFSVILTFFLSKFTENQNYKNVKMPANLQTFYKHFTHNLQTIYKLFTKNLHRFYIEFTNNLQTFYITFT